MMLINKTCKKNDDLVDLPPLTMVDIPPLTMVDIQHLNGWLCILRIDLKSAKAKI